MVGKKNLMGLRFLTQRPTHNSLIGAFSFLEGANEEMRYCLQQESTLAKWLQDRGS